MAGARGQPGLASCSLAEGPSLDGIISAHLSQPPTKTGSAGTRCSTFLRLSSPNCSAQGDAIRLHRPHSSLPRPCQAPTRRGRLGSGGSGPFWRAQARVSQLPDTQNDLDLSLVFQGKPRGLSKAVVRVELATAPLHASTLRSDRSSCGRYRSRLDRMTVALGKLGVLRKAAIRLPGCRPC